MLRVVQILIGDREPLTVSVHVSASAKFVSEFSVKTCGPPVATAVCGPLDVHEIVYQVSVTSTFSLKVTVIFASKAPTAPLAGVVEDTPGALSPSQK